MTEDPDKVWIYGSLGGSQVSKLPGGKPIKEWSKKEKIRFGIMLIIAYGIIGFVIFLFIKIS